MTGENAPSPYPTVATVVREQLGCAWSRARKLCTEGRVTVDGERCLDPAARVTRSAVVVVDATGPRLRATGALAEEAIVFFDRDVVVVEKPAGMLSVADEAGNKDTLGHHLRTLLRRVDRKENDAALGVVHRLDRDTSGLMAFTRNASAHRELSAQFRDHTVERAYHAIAHGEVHAGRIETDLILDRGDGLRGSHGHYKRSHEEPPREARNAITHVKPLERLEGTTLVECRLETGRQHQIRIHLAEHGHPIVGETVYIRDYVGTPIAAPRAMLHARALGFTHPRTGKAVYFEREAPEDFQRMVEKLRGRRNWRGG